MGWAERVARRRWAWLYRQPRWRRLMLAARWFVPTWRRQMFRGGFRAWLVGQAHRPPWWSPADADLMMIREARQQARHAAASAARSRCTLGD